MTSKMNWACNTCGMASGRRQSVQRHIANPRIHGGNAIALSFVEYLAGLTAGLYPRPYGIHNHHLNARAVGAFRVHEEQPKESFFDKIQEKVQRLHHRRRFSRCRRYQSASRHLLDIRERISLV